MGSAYIPSTKWNCFLNNIGYKIYWFYIGWWIKSSWYKGSSFIILMIKLEGIRFQSIKPLFTSYTRKGLRISICTPLPIQQKTLPATAKNLVKPSTKHLSSGMKISIYPSSTSISPSKSTNHILLDITLKSWILFYGGIFWLTSMLLITLGKSLINKIN